MENKHANPDLGLVCKWMEWEEDAPQKGEDLKDWLSQRIAWMLENQGEKLMQAFYRLDVSEAKVRSVFSSHTPEFWPGLLADLVLEREKERAFWRSKYAS
jgi:hypothetical protein